MPRLVTSRIWEFRAGPSRRLPRLPRARCGAVPGPPRILALSQSLLVAQSFLEQVHPDPTLFLSSFFLAPLT